MGGEYTAYLGKYFHTSIWDLPEPEFEPIVIDPEDLSAAYLKHKALLEKEKEKKKKKAGKNKLNKKVKKARKLRKKKVASPAALARHLMPGHPC